MTDPRRHMYATMLSKMGRACGGFWIQHPDGTPTRTNCILCWGQQQGDYLHRRVALDTLENGLTVSTVFLGVNQRILDEGPPLLWETVVLDKDSVGHRKMMEAWHTRPQDP